MEQPIPSQNKRKQSRMSPPPNTGGDADSVAQENTPPNNRSSTPPVPLLRPAQGAWDKAYAFGKVPLQLSSQPPTKSSPAAHTRSKDKSSASGPAHSRIAHPESAQRHSQPPAPGPGPSSASYPAAPNPASASASSEHYRHSAYGRHNNSASPYEPSPPDNPAPPPPIRSPPRQGLPYPAPSGYYPSQPPPVQAEPHPRYSQNPYPPAQPQQSQQPQQQWSAPPPGAQEETIALLIEDVRYGSEPDYLIADVRVTLQPGEEGGWWADGEEVIKALQASTQRLEGNAKIFARRGKYRQCFVRMSDDGSMECQPSSVMVLANKTVQMILEPNPESRHVHPAHSLPPQSDGYARPYPPQRGQYDYGPPYGNPAQNYASPPYFNSPQNPNGKRASGPSEGEEYHAKRAKVSTGTPASSAKPRPVSVPSRQAHSQAVPSSSRPSTAGGARPSGSLVGLGLASAAGAPATRASSPESLADPISPYGPFQRHESVPVAVKAPKEVVNASIVAYLRSHIQNEDGYNEFAASKGRLLPIPDLLKGYRFATRIVNTWANRKTPPTVEGCPNKRITKNHVLQALFRQTSWGSDCEQTLQLADKYGLGGPREDPRVVDLLNGRSMLPEKTGDKLGRSQGSVALLDFLKDVDKDYKNKQEEEVRKSTSSVGKDSNEGSKDAAGDRDGDGD